MTTELIVCGGSALVAVLAGGGAGAFVSWRLRWRESIAKPETAKPEPARDPFIDASIDIAAVDYAEAHNLPPQAAGVVAARLKNLHDISRDKGWTK